MLDFSITDLTHGTLADAHKLGLGLLMTCGFIGVAILWGALFSRAEQRRIDDVGLHWGRAKKQESIPWIDVAILTAEIAKSGKVASFKVIEAPPTSRTVTWPVNVRWVQRPDGVSSDEVGSQFAAIVAERAGVKLTTEWEE